MAHSIVGFSSVMVKSVGMDNALPFISKTAYMGCLMVSDGTQERYIYNAFLF